LGIKRPVAAQSGTTVTAKQVAVLVRMARAV
jgi:hypothetical protein